MANEYKEALKANGIEIHKIKESQNNVKISNDILEIEIEHLKQINQMQAQEIIFLKSLLQPKGDLKEKAARQKA